MPYGQEIQGPHCMGFGPERSHNLRVDMSRSNPRLLTLWGGKQPEKGQSRAL